jgi:transposase-like protein
MPRKKPEKSTALVAVSRHDLPQTRRTRKTGERVLGTTRSAFLKAYETSGGNVTKACQLVGIHRRTFYRWRDSMTRVNVKFRKRLATIRPTDFLLDTAESTITSAMNNGDVTAAIFTLKTKGRQRGWNERPENLAVLEDLIDRVASAYRMWLEDHPDAEMTEKIKWLNRFAENGKVQPRALAKKVGIPLESDSVN